MMRRAAVSFPLLLLLLVTLCPAAQAATSLWDPDDQPGVLDLRWAGLYLEDAHTVRLGISLWSPVTRAQLADRDTRSLRVSIPSIDVSADIVPRSGGGWSAQFWYQDAYVEFTAKATHPKPRLFRLWFDAKWLLSVPEPGVSNYVEVQTVERFDGKDRYDVLSGLRL